MQHRFKYSKPFQLENGGELQELEIDYTSYGNLNKDKSNVIWVCHALTANADPTQWWPGMVGEGKLFDPSKYFIVCANILGSCYGTTGPLSDNPKTGKPYYHSFPFVTIRDIANTYELLRKHLQIDKVHTAIGGSMGGMQALEWTIEQPNVIEHLILIGSNAKNSAWGIAFHESQRMAIEADQTWKENRPDAGLEGMKVARSIGLLSYRNYETYCVTQTDQDDRINNFSASSYQRYQGKKLGDRFNAFSYYLLCDTMDSHNIGRGRGKIEDVLKGIKSKTCCIAIDSDNLFPVAESRFMANHIANGHYEEIHSFYGHDGFLTESEQLTKLISKFYNLKTTD